MEFGCNRKLLQVVQRNAETEHKGDHYQDKARKPPEPLDRSCVRSRRRLLCRDSLLLFRQGDEFVRRQGLLSKHRCCGFDLNRRDACPAIDSDRL